MNMTRHDMTRRMASDAARTDPDNYSSFWIVLEAQTRNRDPGHLMWKGGGREVATFVLNDTGLFPQPVSVQSFRFVSFFSFHFNSFIQADSPERQCKAKRGEGDGKALSGMKLGQDYGLTWTSSWTLTGASTHGHGMAWHGMGIQKGA